MADKSIQLLLLIDALKHTNMENPKTTPKLIQDISAALQNIYPDEAPETLSPATIGRHIKAMNKSGLYHIATCKNAKDGYYCARFPFDAAEFSIIAQALYRSTTLSTKETHRLLEKFLNQTDDLGEGYLNIMMKQLQRTSPRRKPPLETLPVIHTIIKAIWEQKQLRFNYYERHDRNKDSMKKRVDEKTGKPITYTVSPYYLVWNMDECYLIAHCTKHDTKLGKHLSHFKVSLITDQAQLMYEPACSIAEMIEYPRYRMERTIPEYVAIYERKKKTSSDEEARSFDNRAAMVMFSLDRYMRENLFLFHDTSPIVDIRLYFRASFIGTLMAQFNLDRTTLKAYPTGRKYPDGEPVCSAIITVQENEGLYMWLMQQGTYVTVAEPQAIRTKLKNRLQETLKAIDEYESGPLDPIDPDKLKKEKENIRKAEMMRDMLLIRSH